MRRGDAGVGLEAEYHKGSPAEPVHQGLSHRRSVARGLRDEAACAGVESFDGPNTFACEIAEPRDRSLVVKGLMATG